MELIELLVIHRFVFFFQAEDGIRDLVRSRGLGDVYKRQVMISAAHSQSDLDQALGIFRKVGKELGVLLG